MGDGADEPWVSRAEAALGGAPGEGVDLLTPVRPPVLDPVGVKAVLSLPMAAFVWAAAVFRETVADSSLDPVSLLLRLLALGLSLRAVLLCRVLLARMSRARQRSDHGLALCDEGLLLRTPEGDFPVEKRHILAIREEGTWQNKGGRRWADVYVVTHPDAGRSHLRIPPFFERTPGVLAERLMRWRGALPEPVEGEPPARARLASKLFDAVAAGERPAATVVIEHGRGWLKRGPYATVLLGIAMLDGLLRLPEPQRERLGLLAPSILVLALGIVPVFWIVLTGHHIAPRKGIALILTPAEMLMRTRAGVHRVAWNQVTGIDLQSRRVWSILEGAHEARTLIISDQGGSTISYAEAFLGAPAEVVLSLSDAYRKGLVREAST